MANRTIHQALRRADAHLRGGEVDKARRICLDLLDKFPGNVDVRQELARIDAAQRAAAPPAPPRDQVNGLMALLQQGQFAAVVAHAQAMLRQYPGSAMLWSLLGSAAAQSNQLDLGVAAFREADRLQPDQYQTLNNLGNVLQYQGNMPDAITCYRRTLALRPDLAETHFNLGAALMTQGQMIEATGCFERALAINPQSPDGRYALASVLQECGRLDEAIAHYRQVLALRPDLAAAHYNLGHALQQLGRIDDAVASYRQAVQYNPDLVDAYSNLGNALRDLGRLHEAAEQYQQALARNPDLAEVHCSLGRVLLQLAQVDQAIAHLQRALALKPGFAEAYTGLGDAYRLQGRCDAATEAYRTAQSIRPDLAFARAQMLHQQYHMCDWQGFDHLAADCAALASQPDPVPPFCLLALIDSGALQLQLTRRWAADLCKRPIRAVPPPPAQRPERLRVGYFSADFHDHATLCLMAGLLRHHDRSQFEIFAYSYGRDAAGQMGARARQDVEHFFDVTDLPSHAIADLARSHGIDIAIDLKGYTAHGRTDLFADRPAPVQISYLGYPGTLGAPFIDYILADPVVIPDDLRAWYSERVIWLPHSYQANDDTRIIAETATTRADFGLPETGVVLCSFNNSYKITPREFDIWMRVLDRIDGSVLWLLRANPWCEGHLRQEAAARGIAPERLVFADRASHADHLARHRHADLFLDTFNCNAHTTASDALWAGLPLVTRVGEQFAARVSASLLTAIGLPELITHDDAGYEALILQLAADPARLSAIKAQLADNRLTRPLFDTRLYTRHYEAGLQQAYDLYLAGQPARDIRVAPLEKKDA